LWISLLGITSGPVQPSLLQQLMDWAKHVALSSVEDFIKHYLILAAGVVFIGRNSQDVYQEFSV